MDHTSPGQDGGPELDRARKRKQRQYEKKKEKRKLKRAGTFGAAKSNEDDDSTSTHSDEPDDPTHRVYEVQLARGKGLGLFALLDIARGTCIVSEEPLVHWPVKQRARDIINRYSRLSRRKQRHYIDLCSSPDRSKSDGQSLSAFERYIVDVYNTNSVPTSSGRAIYLSCARINHDCTPNVVICNRSEGNMHVSTVHAIRDIAAGEELSSAYTDVCQSIDQRAHDLSRFQCRCSICDRRCPDPDADVHNLRRKRLGLLKAILEDDAACDPALMQRAATEMVELLHKEALLGLELVFAYSKLATAALGRGNRLRAKVYKRKELDVLRACYGSDSAAVEDRAKELDMMDRARR